MIICDLDKCTGCMLCYNLCPVNAITIKGDRYGFSIPEIDSVKCIKCNICKSKCPQNNDKNKFLMSKDVYAMWSKDTNLRMDSTSGGVFSGLAEAVIKAGGCVYGAAFDETFRVLHQREDSLEVIYLFRFSKYLQSDIGDTYRQIKKDLQSDKWVLFSGTPCQVKALKEFLSIKYNKLLLVDIVCHGVPSPLVWEHYLYYIKEKYNADKIENVSFRNKDHAWSLFLMKIVFSSGIIYKANAVTDPFLLAFLNNFCLRKACHECKYTCLNREGDVTLGDFWGYVSDTYKFRNDEKGISLVIINTAEGADWLKKIESGYYYTRKDIEETLPSNGP